MLPVAVSPGRARVLTSSGKYEAFMRLHKDAEKMFETLSTFRDRVSLCVQCVDEMKYLLDYGAHMQPEEHKYMSSRLRLWRRRAQEAAQDYYNALDQELDFHLWICGKVNDGEEDIVADKDALGYLQLFVKACKWLLSLSRTSLSEHTREIVGRKHFLISLALSLHGDNTKSLLRYLSLEVDK